MDYTLYEYESLSYHMLNSPVLDPFIDAIEALGSRVRLSPRWWEWKLGEQELA